MGMGGVGMDLGSTPAKALWAMTGLVGGIESDASDVSELSLIRELQ